MSTNLLMGIKINDQPEMLGIKINEGIGQYVLAIICPRWQRVVSALTNTARPGRIGADDPRQALSAMGRAAVVESPAELLADMPRVLG